MKFILILSVNFMRVFSEELREFQSSKTVLIERISDIDEESEFLRKSYQISNLVDDDISISEETFSFEFKSITKANIKLNDYDTSSSNDNNEKNFVFKDMTSISIEKRKKISQKSVQMSNGIQQKRGKSKEIIQRIKKKKMKKIS
ncbi:hypothetical protein PVAND_001956 [Polypedilum vanderplanki]|uniref:Uncharacterized protein n=1 Tax=Polypedilum vanderplanki TaxID=319348 RepID=A0A9J6BQS4_POLVA|nr:hypothetical protein PVAND_001956 [Polypedilum vanderplanki]